MRSNRSGKRVTVTVRCPPALVPALHDLDTTSDQAPWDDAMWQPDAWRDEEWEARAAAWADLIDEADVLDAATFTDPGAGPEIEVEPAIAAAVDVLTSSTAAVTADGDEGPAPGGALSVDEVLAAAGAAGAGAQAISLLASLSGRELSADQRLSVVQLWQPQLAWVTGAEQAAVYAFTGPTPDPDDPVAVLTDSFTAGELGPALGCSPAQAQHKIDYARVLHQRFPATAAQLQAGRLDPYRCWLLVDRLSTLHPAAAAVVEAELLPQAAGWATGTLAGKLRDACRAADPDWTLRMYAKARKTRRLWFDTDREDGMVCLFAALPPVEALAMQQHLETAAHRPSQDPDDNRCKDERMADALIAAVLGSTPGDPTTPLTPNVTAQVLVSLPTLLGLRDDCGELRGYGPIPPGLARALAGDAAWQRWVYDPVDGHLLDLGRHRYRPNPDLDAYVRARDRVERWPGGTLTATRCDLDHTQPFDHTNTPTCKPPDDNDPPDTGGPPDDDDPPGNAGPDNSDLGGTPPEPRGPTGAHAASPPDDDGCPRTETARPASAETATVTSGEAQPENAHACPHPGGATASHNLISLSRRAHRAKTLGGYHTTQDPDGTLHLTTPLDTLGRTHTTKPWDYRPTSETRE